MKFWIWKKYFCIFLKNFYEPLGGAKGIGRSKFSERSFSILIADLDSLQKSMNVKWTLFFYILMFSLLKSQKTSKFCQQMNNEPEISRFCKFWGTYTYQIKKRKPLYIHTFLQGIQICNRNSKIPSKKIWYSYIPFAPPDGK